MRALCGGTIVIEHELKAVRYLRREVPERLGSGGRRSRGPSPRPAATCPGPDRARAFDAFFWAEAKRRLASDDVTAIVNRQAALLAEPGRIEAYARFCGAVTAAALLQLDEPLRVEDEAAALIHFFARSEPHREAALDWIGAGHHLSLASRLPVLARLRLPAADPLAQRQRRELPRPGCLLGGDAGPALSVASAHQAAVPARANEQRAGREARR